MARQMQSQFLNFLYQMNKPIYHFMNYRPKFFLHRGNSIGIWLLQFWLFSLVFRTFQAFKFFHSCFIKDIGVFTDHIFQGILILILLPCKKSSACYISLFLTLLFLGTQISHLFFPVPSIRSTQ